MRLGELDRGRRLLVLAICCLSLLLVGLGITIVNVGLPAIRGRTSPLVIGAVAIGASAALVLIG